jgi:hypothetical protein
MKWFRIFLWTITAMTVAALGVQGCAVLDFHMLTGHWVPIHIEERLQSPLTVRGWSRDGLLLEDGRLVPLPGIEALPTDSEALKQGTARGIEITPDGRVMGLLKVHHWCGNDPVRLHIVRVDLSYLLMWLNEGRYKPLPNDIERDFDYHRSDKTLSDRGFRIESYMEFPDWTARLRKAGR